MASKNTRGEKILSECQTLLTGRPIYNLLIVTKKVIKSGAKKWISKKSKHFFRKGYVEKNVSFAVSRVKF